MSVSGHVFVPRVTHTLFTLSRTRCLVQSNLIFNLLAHTRPHASCVRQAAGPLALEPRDAVPRSVFSLAHPTPLLSPEVVAVSQDALNLLGIGPDQESSGQSFLTEFSSPPPLAIAETTRREPSEALQKRFPIFYPLPFFPVDLWCRVLYSWNYFASRCELKRGQSFTESFSSHHMYSRATTLYLECPELKSPSNV